MSGVFSNSSSSIYATNTDLADAINQIQLVGAIAPFIQTTNALASWNTSDPPGIGSNHNLLNDNTVFLDPNTGDMTQMNSLSFKAGVLADPVTGSLWLNDSNNHLYHGNIDLETVGGGNVTSTSSPVSNNALVRYDGTSGTFIETSDIISGPVNTQFYLPSGPQISISGIQLPNPALATTSVYLEHYSTSFVIADYTGPYLVPPGNVLLLLERIGNIANITVASGLIATADAAAPAAIVMTTPVPISYRPTTATKTGLLNIVTGGVYQVGSWEMTNAGILTIRPSPDPASNFPSPLAGNSGVVAFQNFSYTLRN